MRHEQFIGRVQAGARLSDTGAAERTVRATLETLGERVPCGLAQHLAAQLPVEIGEHLRRVAADQPEQWRSTGERFGLSGFAGRVAWRTGGSESTALERAAAVLEVLDAAVSPEQMDKLYSVLPHDIRRLLPPARQQDASLDATGPRPDGARPDGGRRR